MSRIARSNDPLYVTRGAPFSFPMRMQDNTGTPIDLTGAGVSCLLQWVGTQKPLVVVMGSPLSDGKFTVSCDAETTEKLPLGLISEIVVTVTDSLGFPRNFVYPVKGETP